VVLCPLRESREGSGRFGVVLEIRADVFFAGSDLPDGQALAKLDVALGLRFDL